MRTVAEMCVRDCPWLPDEEGVNFVNDLIPWPTCGKLGVKTRRQEALRDHVFGIPFGQREKLTNRLRRILRAYPCEKGILKELLQNADDAQATEICFIKDPRHHEDKRVFEDIWKPLQGPALCVYNNKPFRNEDIEGIRNLGEGSKGDDPNKTGQYGVGFNAVYHLTDVPSFMTKGKEIGEALCAFDPHCRYVPQAKPQEPGVLMKNITPLRKRFPDVFPCYLENNFQLENGTMFRFPLRTRQMAQYSQISDSPVTLEMVDIMLEDLKKELFEVLLFVNNVKKITICEVHKNSGKIVHDYYVETSMSVEDENKRKAFAEYIKQIGEKIKEGTNLLPSDIPVATVSYVLNISDSLGNQEKWLVVQQLGFEKTVKKSINAAFKRNELGMLPRGGVACLLEKRNLKAPAERRKKAYCFLPLPFETNLPVHINGHFALDHEARRSLWRDEGSGYRSDWNYALLEDVVASCYLTLLVEFRAFLELPLVNSSCTVTCSESELLQKINAYERLFPLERPTDPYWKILVDSFFHCLAMREIRVLPVVRKTSQGAIHDPSKNSTTFEVEWLPVIGSGKNQAFFNNLAEESPFSKSQSKNRLKEVLLESGFNLVALSLAMHHSLQWSGISTCCISPSSVIDFYKSFSSSDPLCAIGPIPCHIKNTPFRDYLGIILVLLYCKGVKDFYGQLPGLPLLLTKDNCLQIFSSKNPKFLSRFHDILPGSPNIFMHERVDQKVFQNDPSLKSSVVKPLDLQGFAANLPQTLKVEHYGQGRYEEWFPNQTELPNQRWISRVWFFLSTLTMDKVLWDPKSSEETNSLQIKASLELLANWSILPCTESKSLEGRNSILSFFGVKSCPPLTHFLVPLCHSTAVLDFDSSDATNSELLEVLRKLGVPELNYTAISALSSQMLMIARLMASSLKVPASLLAALSHKIERQPDSPQTLDSEDCRSILVYFSRSITSLKDSDRRKLRKLPFYQATHGGFIPLDGNRRVCVLPAGIPRKQIDALERHLHLVFIESGALLSDLFKFLVLECVSAVDVYCTYLLPNLDIFEQDTRQAHLEYIRKNILSDPFLLDRDKQRMQHSLRNTPIIPTANGTLRTASSFYDPCVDVFCIMLSESHFPPKPLNSLEWLEILRTIGLIHKVSHELLTRFAREVADEAVTQRTEKTVEKSRTLVKHIMHRHNVVEEGLLPAICSIPFVASESPRKALIDICQPFMRSKDGESPFCAFKGAVSSEYAEVVWTQASLLPRWADPRACRHELGAPGRKNLERYCTVFTAQLQISSKPSVELVVRHCQTVCYLHENKNESENSSLEERATKTGVMERVYQFLQNYLTTDSEEKSILVNTPCVLVDDGKKFIHPRQAVLELYESHEIKPFLYRVPRAFGKFQRLFHEIGCEKCVTSIHYAMVLQMLYERCKNSKLHPNEVTICVRAVQGFFQNLDKNLEKVKSLSLLYLPGMSIREVLFNEMEHMTPINLEESRNLVLNDVPPALLHRLQTFNYPILDLRSMRVNCSSSKTNYQEQVMKLPTAIRPKMLSCMVQEKYLSENNIASPIGYVKSLTQRLSSPIFSAAIIRLIRDQGLSRKEKYEHEIEDIQKGLQSIDICVVDNLQTILFYGGSPIPQSEARVPHFLERDEVSRGGKWTVYLNSVKGIEESSSLISSVSNVIVELYGVLLGRRAVLIPQMLTCPLDDIWALLDASGVRQDDSYCAAEIKVFPTLGKFIPLDYHHLLNDAFEEFDPGDYVGYELEDPSLNHEPGVPTYIYAMILDEVTEEGLPLSKKGYRIDVGGNEILVVDAIDLYKFHRLPTTLSSEVVGFEHKGRNPPLLPRSRNQREVFDDISDLLEDAWKLPEEKRRKIVKRLYLQWHPDKNVGDEEFCTEVSKHILSETSRLERGLPRGSQKSSEVDSSRSQHGFYDDFFHSWEERAKDHHTQREGYRYRQQFFRNTPRAKNPQPGEARRWFRQAEADIAATENDIVYQRPSYEWACFKCHQAAEKALKAAQYAIDVERTNVHNLLQICQELEDSELTQLASQLECLVVNSTRMRYPDRVCFPKIPNEVYSGDVAVEALRLAKKIVERVKNRLA